MAKQTISDTERRTACFACLADCRAKGEAAKERAARAKAARDEAATNPTTPA
jgi:hypothetical protein